MTAHKIYYSPDRQQRLVIKYDSDPINPREDSEPATRMWCEHSRYLLGDRDSPKTDLVEAIEKLAAAQGINFEDEYVECPACAGSSATYDNPLDLYPAGTTQRVDVMVQVGDSEEREITDVMAGAIDEKVVVHWSPVCDQCDDDGDVENEDFNDLEDSRQIGIALERVDPDEEYIFRLPLYLYDHGGITMNTGGFSCPWDSGCVGVIFITREKVIEEGMWGATDSTSTEELRQLGRRVMEGDVETYDQYLRGDVYGFRLEKLMPKPGSWTLEDWADVDEHWEETDSCWGFYGDNVKENGMLDHAGISEEEFEKWKEE